MSQQSAQETKLQVSKQELQAAEAKLQAAEAKLQAAEAKLQAAEASKNESLITSARAILSSTTDGVVTAQGAVKTAQDAVTYWSNLLYSSPAVPVLASPRSKSSQSSSSSDGSGEFSLKIHSPEIDGRTINIEVINRGTASKHQRLRHESGKIMGSKQILAEIAAIKTHLEKSEARRIAAETELKQERQQREAERAKFETEFKQVMAQLQQKEQTLVSVQAAATDQANTSNQQVTHHKAKQEQKQGPSLMSRIRAWRSPSRRGPSYTGPASTPTTFASSSPLSVPSSPPNTPPHRATTSAASSPLSTQLMSPGTTATTSSSSPHCPVCHEPIDDDLYEMVECKHLFHLACARFVWNRQHRREETPYCVFPGCNEPVKHSPTKRLARIVEESSSRSDSDISDPSHRSIGQTNPSFDRQSIGSQDTVVSQATSTESNQSQPLTNVTHNTVAFSSSSSSSSSSNSASTSTSTSAPTQEHKQPPTIVASTGSGPASSSDA